MNRKLKIILDLDTFTELNNAACLALDQLHQDLDHCPVDDHEVARQLTIQMKDVSDALEVLTTAVGHAILKGQFVDEDSDSG